MDPSQNERPIVSMMTVFNQGQEKDKLEVKLLLLGGGGILQMTNVKSNTTIQSNETVQKFASHCQ
jgi:hypothetical protein